MYSGEWVTDGKSLLNYIDTFSNAKRTITEQTFSANISA